MEDEKINEILDKIFLNVNSWLNFAEAKNAANIALVITCITAIFSFDYISVLSYVICTLFAVSGICSLISFVPRLGDKVKKSFLGLVEKRFPRLVEKFVKKKDVNDNLLFYDAIKKYSGEEYVEQVTKLYLQIDKKDFTRYQIDLAKEIVYNSDIASRKYKLFSVAAFLDVVVFILFVVCAMIA